MEILQTWLIEQEHNEMRKIDWEAYDKIKWVKLNDLMELLDNWNCQGNPDIKKTINTLKMRIKE